MSLHKRKNLATEWLINDWLEDYNINYTEQLWDKAFSQVEDILQGISPKEGWPWYEIEEVSKFFIKEDYTL